MSNTADETTSSSQTYMRLLHYITPYWKVFLLALIANGAYSFIDTELIKAFEPLVDEGLTNKNLDYLIYAPAFVIVAILLRGLAGFIATYCMSWVGNNMIMELRRELFDRYLLLSASFYDANKSGNLLSKVIYNTEQLNKSTTEAITTIIRSSALIVFALWAMFSESWQLTLIFLVTAPLIAVSVNLTSKRFRLISRRVQESMGNISHVTQEGIESYQVIKIYGGQAFEQQLFDKENRSNRLQSMKMIITKALSVAVIPLLASFGLALVLYFAISYVDTGDLTPGGFISLVMLMMVILKPLKSLASVNAILQRGIVAAESIFEVLDEPIEVDEGTRTIERAKGDITFADVNFKYTESGQSALKNINLNIPAGKTVALVGRSGSGKSTLASILLRFYSVQTGNISLDGHRIEDYSLVNYRKQIAYVSQQVTLFNDSIAHNIAYGNLENTSIEDIISAAKKAHAWEFISELPDGLDTMVGEKGMLLSGGQRQRLAIARAILKDAPILILDEATSALDTESEKYIQEAMDTVMENRTTVVVAHRLSTIETADEIIVMDQGEIKESGTHKALLELDGIYAGLHKMQFKD